MTFCAEDCHIESCKRERRHGVDSLAKLAIVTVANNTLCLDIFSLKQKKQPHRLDPTEWKTSLFLIETVIHTRISEEPAGFVNCVNAFTGAARTESTLFSLPHYWNGCKPVGGVGIKGSNLNRITGFNVWFDVLFLGSVWYFMGRNEKCAMCCVRKDPSRGRNGGNGLLLFLFCFVFFLEGFTPQPVSDWSII